MQDNTDDASIAPFCWKRDIPDFLILPAPGEDFLEFVLLVRKKEWHRMANSLLFCPAKKMGSTDIPAPDNP